MWIRYAGLLGYLALGAEQDLKKRTVSVRLAASAILLAAVLQLCLRQMSWQEWAAGLLPGMFLLCAGRLTGEAVGYGDGLALLVCGVFLGFWGGMAVLTVGLFLSCPAALALLVWKRADRKTAMPFLPFLLAGYLVWLIIL